jgi:hypothetical protein
MSVIDGPNLANTSDLIFYLDAANPKSYPGTGSTWYDITANKNNFTLFNTPTYTSNGTTGTYLTFNGSNQYVRSTNAINFNAYSAVTIEIGYRTTVTNTTQILYETTGTGASTATGGITLLMNSNNTGTVANTYLSQWQGYGTRLFGYTVSTSTAFNAITETFVNGVDASGRQTYVNSTLATYFTNTSVVSAATTTTSGLAFANTWTYVASRAGTSNFFNGDIAYVKAYGIKISSTNISSNLTTIGLKQPASYPTPTLITSDTSVVAPSLYSFTSFQFTNAGGTYNTGPTLANALATYDTVTYSWLNNTSYFNIVTQGIQQWTVPQTGNYRILAVGGTGGAFGASYVNNAFPGAGASIQGDFALTSGAVINIVVGQCPNLVLANNSANGSGGGGGTFVYTSSIGGAGLMIAAGGGGGTGHGSSITTGGNGKGGSSTTNSREAAPGETFGVNSKTNGPGSSGNLGVGYGGRGTFTSSYSGSGGGTGWLGIGQDDQIGAQGKGGGQFVGGTSTAVGTTYGGFGGGGGAGGNGVAGGGGGGYTGGGAGQGYTTSWGASGGGGSYNTGTNQTNTQGADGVSTYVHGYVTITKL